VLTGAVVTWFVTGFPDLTTEGEVPHGRSNRRLYLDASRRGQPVPRLAAWSLGTGIVATVGANLAHGIGHGPVGALVSAWPALALVGSFKLLMMLIRAGRRTRAGGPELGSSYQPAPPLAHEALPELSIALTLEQTVRARYEAGRSQRHRP
jgi:hypothetical protein